MAPKAKRRRSSASVAPKRRLPEAREAPWLTLQDDLIVHIGRACGAADLLALTASCKTWRKPLGAAEKDLWKALALQDFRRLRAILALSAPPASYLELYKGQYAVDTSSPSKSMRKTTLSDFIFSVECCALPMFAARAAPRFKTTKRTFTWTGKLTKVITCPYTKNGLMVCDDGKLPRLPLDSDAMFPRSLSGMASESFSNTVLKVYATHQLKTVKLYEGALDRERFKDDLDDSDDENPYEKEFDKLDVEDGKLPRRFGQHELWDDPQTPDAEPMLGMSLRVAGEKRGEIDICFIQDEINVGNMTTEQVHGYLEHMAPWP